MTTNSTARRPQASDTAEQCAAMRQKDNTLSNPLIPEPARASRIAECAQFYAMDACADARDPHYYDQCIDYG